jgi:hypothetical protein
MGFNSISGPQSFDFFIQAKYLQIFEFQQDFVQKWFVNTWDVGSWQDPNYNSNLLCFLAIDMKILI